MEEFKPEDGLRSDVDDRPSRHQKKAPTSTPFLEHYGITRQHIMIAIGIIVLLILMWLISSILTSSGPATSGSNSDNTGARDINLSSQNNNVPSGEPQLLQGQDISPTPTQAQPQDNNDQQQRLTIPGDVVDTLGNNSGFLLPTGDASLSSAAGGASSAANNPVTGTTSGSKTTTNRPADAITSRPAHTAGTSPATAGTKPASSKSSNASSSTNASTSAAAKGSYSGRTSSLKQIPASHYTLQLSGASRSDTLQAFARQHNLQQYWVYETQHNGKPWYVLVSGNYSSISAAKQAITTLPPDVQAKSPWVKPVSKVHQEIK